MKITRRQLRKLILREMAHQRDPMDSVRGKSRSMAMTPLGDETSKATAGTEEVDPYAMLSGPYEHDIRDEEAYEGRLAQEEAFEEYLKILDDLAVLQARAKEIQDTWGFDL